MRKPILLMIAFVSLFGYANAQWNWLNPSPTGNQLRGVSFTDANNGTAVGKLGTILRTTDGGVTWTLQTSGTTNFLTGVHFVDASNGTVVGYSNNVGGEATILHTTDGGTTWNWQSSGTTDYLNGVFFTDANTGTAVGSNGKILRTTDGGATWVMQTSGTTGSLNGVYFTSTNTGIIVGTNGILRTTDGGTSWNSVSTNSLNAVSFSDANIGTAVGSNNTILRTTDGGATWIGQSAPTATYYGVSMTDANTGTAVGTAGKIVHTIDAGIHWLAQTSGTTNVLFSISCTDNNTGTVVGDVGKIIRTINGGTNWVFQSKGETYDMYGVSFTDANTGTAVGGGPAAPTTGRILRTADGGANWTLTTSPVANRLLYGVYFTDANTGTAVGVFGTIIKTTNGGVTWTQQTSGLVVNLMAVCFTDANTGTVVGSSGKILRTTNGGTNWAQQTSGTTQQFFAVHFTDANNGTAVAQGGVIVHTTDGGANWITQSSGVGWNLYGVYFTDANTGWAAGSSGILHTTDGGANWIQQPIPGGASFYSISMSDANTGTAVGVAGKIYQTTDGGANWISQFSGTSVDLRGVTCLSTGNSFAVGKTGTIIVFDAPSQWNGAVDNSWTNAGNWTDGVPLTGSSAIIGSAANQPSISTIVSLYGLTINTNAVVTISPAGQVTLTNSLVNTGTLTIQSDATGTGSLIHNTAGISANVERYIAGSVVANHGWHLLGSPVDAQAISAFHTPGSGNDFYKWDEPTDTWINRTAEGGGLNGAFETNFGVGTGYLVSYAATDTKIFSGSLNVSNVSVTGLSNTPASTAVGWHLLGNPYSSALTWNDGNWNLSNVDANCQIWDETNASYSVILPNGIIPSMNGFMAHASVDGASMTIPSVSRTHDATNWYKNAEQINQIVLTVRDIEGQTAQPTIIRFKQDATIGYDSQFDSYYLPGFAPMFYSNSQQESYALNTLPELNQGLTIPLGLVKNSGNQFVIELTENIQGQDIYLTDKQTLQTVKLNEGDYVFSSQQDDAADRFELHFSVVGIEDNTLADANLHAWASNGQLYLQNEHGPVTLLVSDLQGRTLVKSYIATSGTRSQPLNLTTGIYIVSIQTASKNKSMKIFVR